MLSRFTHHPATVNETYLQHMRMALGFSGRFCYGAMAALVHAFFPFWFEKTGSELISDLHRRMVTQRDQKAPDSFEADTRMELVGER